MECNKLNIPEHWHRNLDGSYDILGNACITKEYVQNGRLRVRIRKVSGNFIGKDLIANTRYHITKSTKIISAKVLPLYTNNPRREVHCIDWTGFRRSIREYFSWIPRNPNITHINLTPKQKSTFRNADFTIINFVNSGINRANIEVSTN